MRAQVVYESMFGNTMLIAEAIAEGVARHGQVDMVEVGTAGPPAHDLDLLIVGGPTHAFGLSRPSTRANAAQPALRGIASPGVGLREWIATLAGAGLAIPAATFDTRLASPAWLPGSAARSAARHLRRLGIALLVPPESFYVKETLGPLVEGELARARHWGDWVARLVAQGRTVDPAREAVGARRI